MVQFDSLCCNVVQCVAVWYSVLQFVAVCCNVLQCVAVSCSVLQRTAVCCSASAFDPSQQRPIDFKRDS